MDSSECLLQLPDLFAVKRALSDSLVTHWEKSLWNHDINQALWFFFVLLFLFSHISTNQGVGLPADSAWLTYSLPCRMVFLHDALRLVLLRWTVFLFVHSSNQLPIPGKFPYFYELCSALLWILI